MILDMEDMSPFNNSFSKEIEFDVTSVDLIKIDAHEKVKNSSSLTRQGSMDNMLSNKDYYNRDSDDDLIDV